MLFQRSKMSKHISNMNQSYRPFPFKYKQIIYLQTLVLVDQLLR